MSSLYRIRYKEMPRWWFEFRLFLHLIPKDAIIMDIGHSRIRMYY